MLAQRTPLKRKTRLRQKRATPRRSGRVRDREYMLAVKQLPCCACGTHGPVEADHAGQRPLGRKCNDDECIPMCRKCHRDRTDGTGMFKGFEKYRMRAWCDFMIAATRIRLGAA